MYASPRSPAPGLTTALFWGALAYIAMLVGWNTQTDPVFAQLAAMLAALGVVLLQRNRAPHASRLPWRAAASRQYFGAAAVGASLWLISLQAQQWLVQAVGWPTELPALQRVVAAPNIALVCTSLVIVAPLAEELWFRGLLLPALVPRMRAPLAAIVTAVCFALYHGALAQMPATLLLGSVAAMLTLHSRALGPAVVCHMVNNAVVLALSRGAWPAFLSWREQAPAVTGVGAGIIVATGLWLARRQPSR